jgi:hypothetical protein
MWNKCKCGRLVEEGLMECAMCKAARVSECAMCKAARVSCTSESAGSASDAIDYLEWALGDDSPLTKTLIEADSNGSCAPISTLIEAKRRLAIIKKSNDKVRLNERSE